MEDEDPNRVLVLVALQLLKKHVYAGTVPEKEIARRRAKNKVARKSRSVNRRRK